MKTECRILGQVQRVVAAMLVVGVATFSLVGCGGGPAEDESEYADVRVLGSDEVGGVILNVGQRGSYKTSKKLIFLVHCGGNSPSAIRGKIRVAEGNETADVDGREFEPGAFEIVIENLPDGIGEDSRLVVSLEAEGKKGTAEFMIAK